MNMSDTLIESYFNEHTADAAQWLESLSSDSLREFAPSVPLESILPVFDRLTPSRSMELFDGLPAKDQLIVLSSSPPRVAVLLLAGVDPLTREQLLAQLSEPVRNELVRILNFPEDTAARLMDRAQDTYLISINVREARTRLRKSRSRRARSIYVVDENVKLIGRVDVQDLATSSESTPLASIINEVDGVVEMNANREELVLVFNRLGLDSIPVVDADARLIGIVRYQSLFRAAESVASADLQKMVGVSADERALSSPVFAVKRRLPWLHINLLTAFLAAAVVGLFENLIAQFTALAILLPVVAGQSGNAGSQALAVTMRGLNLREVGLNQWRAVMSKEALVGLINGVALAFTCGLGVYVWSQSFGLAVVIGIAMLLSMVAAGISGAVVPMLLLRYGQDPATASSIILTTVTDVSGFFAFLGTATLLSSML